MLIDVLLFCVLGISFYTDLRWQKIYNVVVFPAVLAGLCFQVWNTGGAGLLFWGKGLLLGLLLLIGPFLLGGIGAGDVKLLGVVGALKGADFVWNSFLVTALLGGVVALVYLAYKRKLSTFFRNLGRALLVFFLSSFRVWNLPALGEDGARHVFPYGIVIAAGTAMTYLVV